MRQLINHMQKFKLTENAIPLRSIIAPLLSLSSCWFISGGDEIPKSAGVVATMRWVPLVLLTATLELERVNADVTGTEIPNNNSGRACLLKVTIFKDRFCVRELQYN